MSTDTERLFVSLEARVADFERRMRQAERTGTRTYSQLQRGSRGATAAMERDMLRSTSRINQALAATSSKIGAFAGAFAGGIVGGVAAIGITGAVSQVGEIARGIAEIGNQAKRAGVSLTAFQEWKFVAEQNRIGIDAMVDGLKELNLRADEFVVTGAGPAAEAFQRLGYGAAELNTKLQDPSALLLEIIGRLQQMDRAAQIRIADELFGGTAGERFVELLDQGEAGIRRTIDRAHELGAVMDAELIAKADAVNRRFEEIATTVGTTLKGAIVSAADSLANFLEGFRAFENQRSTSLQGRVNEVIRERAGLVDKIGRAEGLLSEGGLGEGTGIVDQQLADMRSRVAELTAEEDEIIGILQDRNPPAGWAPDRGTWTPPATKPAAPAKPSSSGGGRSQAAKAADNEREAVHRLIEELMFENSLLGKSAVERETAIALRQAGAAATAEERLQIGKLVEANHAQTEAIGRTEAQLESLRQTGRSVLAGLFEDLREGASGADLLSNALNRVAENLLQMGLDRFSTAIFNGAAQSGAGPFAGVAKALGFAGGGYTGPGARLTPAGVVHAGEFVVRASEVRRPGVRAMLEAVNAGLPGFAAGGLASGSLQAPKLPAAAMSAVAGQGTAGKPGETSRVVIELGEGLEGRILGKAVGQTVQIVRQASIAQARSFGRQARSFDDRGIS